MRVAGLNIAMMSLLLVAALLMGCAHGEHVKPLRSDLVIRIERGDDVPPGSLYLKPIPGGLLGQAHDEELFRSHAGSGQVRVPLAGLSRDLHALAELVRSDAFNPGELASPRELRIARIGAFYEPAVRSDGCNNFRTGLRTDAAGSTMLVYVDGPGSVRGARYTRPYIMDFQLEFPSAGIYLVAMPARGVLVTLQVIGTASPLLADVRRKTCEAVAAAVNGEDDLDKGF